MIAHPDTQRWLELLCSLGPVEIRVPKAKRERVIAGYFTDATVAARAVAELDTRGAFEGIYVTPNPCDPALLSRAANRVKPYAEATTSDTQIARRRWFLIDADPKRPPGISATNEEHAAAIAKAYAVRDALAAEGWPAPILIDSGNGAWVAYAVDEPNDEPTRVLFDAVLKALAARFSDATVKIDTTVANAARIAKVPGTVTRKGDDTPERPHRRAGFLDWPAELVAVTRAQLAALAPAPATERPTPRGKTSSTKVFDLRGWLAKHGLAIGEPRSHDGTGWSAGLKTCPFSNAHVGGAYVGQMASGAAFAGCQHDTCDGKGWAELREMFEPGATRRRAPRDDRPVIRIDADEGRVVREAIEALAADEDVYQRGGALARVQDRGARLPQIQPLSPAALRIHLVDAARFERWNAKEKAYVHTHPDGWIVSGVDAYGAWPDIRSLTAVSTTPVFRPDGSIHATPGYDMATGVLYAPRAAFPAIPEQPTADEIAAAYAALLDPIADFPFRTPNDKSAALAAILSIVARPAIAGPVPLFSVVATTPGTGKTLLADTIITGATGQRPYTIASPPEDNAEWKKQLLTVAIEGPAVVSIDNADGELGSEAFAAALTSEGIDGRILGESRSGGGELRTVWLSTGTNTQLAATMARRTVVVALESELEHPEDRTGFRHDDLEMHVRQVWPQLVSAALTVLRGFVLAGRPRHGKPRLGMFTAWDDTVRSCLMWLGAADPDGARERTRREADADRHADAPAIVAWRAAFGTEPTTAADAVLRTTGKPGAWPTAAPPDRELEAALAGLLRGRKLTPRSLGCALRKLRRKNIGGFRFDQVEGHGGVARWYVEPVNAGGYGDYGGDRSTPHAGEREAISVTVIENSGAAGPETSPPQPPSPPCGQCGVEAILGPRGLCSACHHAARGVA